MFFNNCHIINRNMMTYICVGVHFKLAFQPSCSIHKVEKHSESADLRHAAEAVPAADGSAPWTAAAVRV